jgi:hypothetical protein
MVTATAEVDLKLTDFHPRSMLVTAEHAVERPIVPAIDYHNHLDSSIPAKCSPSWMHAESSAS